MKRELIALTDDLAVRPDIIVAVKRSALEPDRCTVFLAGQSAQDGFVIERDADELIEEISEALGEDGIAEV